MRPTGTNAEEGELAWRGKIEPLLVVCNHKSKGGLRLLVAWNQGADSIASGGGIAGRVAWIGKLLNLEREETSGGFCDVVLPMPSMLCFFLACTNKTMVGRDVTIWSSQFVVGKATF